VIKSLQSFSKMKRIVGISEAGEVLGVSVPTLRRRERAGKLLAEHTAGGHRRYDLAKVRPELFRAEEKSSKKGLKRLLSGILDDQVGRSLSPTKTGSCGSGLNWCLPFAKPKR